jgi:2-oxoglutarate ferredoxin oxidoreductase subunit alpha
MVLADGMIGQMMEPVRLPEFKPVLGPNEIAGKRDWACTGYNDRGGDGNRRVVKSLRMQPEVLEKHVEKLFEKYARMETELARYETENLKGAEVVFVAFGTTARICREACEILSAQGVKAGLIRPLSLWPFPEKAFDEIDFGATKAVISAELSMGQMITDVKLALNGRLPVYLAHRTGGMVPTSPEVAARAKAVLEGLK